MRSFTVKDGSALSVPTGAGDQQGHVSIRHKETVRSPAAFVTSYRMCGTLTPT